MPYSEVDIPSDLPKSELNPALQSASSVEARQRKDYLAVIASLELDALADGNERAEVEEFGDEGVVMKAIPSGRDVIMVKTVTGNVIRTKTIKVLPGETAAPGRLLG